MTDTSIKQAESLVKHMEETNTKTVLGASGKLLIIGTTVAIIVFLVCFAFYKAIPNAPSVVNNYYYYGNSR